MVLAKNARTYSEYKWTIYTWYVLHTMALYAEEELRPVRSSQQQTRIYPKGQHPGKKYAKFLQTLWKDLPCPECMEHYQNYIKVNKLSKHTDFHEWTVGLHNDVNKRLGSRTYTADQARNFYLLEGKLQIDWWYYYFMIKTFANVAYTNGTIARFIKTLDRFAQVVPCPETRRRLPRSRDFTDPKIFIRRFLIVLKKKMDAVPPSLKQLRFTKKTTKSNPSTAK